MGFHKILVAIDDSELCKSVFAQALELAGANGASLMLLNCLRVEMIAEPIVSTSLDIVNAQMLNTDYQVQQIQMERQKQEMQAVLQHYCQTATSFGVPTEFDFTIGEAGQSLCETAESWGADLIVMGRRGRKGLTEALLGSASNYVLHNAPCSVLVIQYVQTQEPS